MYILVQGFILFSNTVDSLCLCDMEFLIPFNFVQYKKEMNYKNIPEQSKSFFTFYFFQLLKKFQILVSRFDVSNIPAFKAIAKHPPSAPIWETVTFGGGKMIKNIQYRISI